jgi:hypothetical protein
LRRIGPYVNTAVFAGHSVIRTAVMGADGSAQVDPTPEQMQTMKALVRDAMDHGAIGFASSFSPNHSGYGGIPMPSTIASEGELRALAGVLGEKNKGVFMMATGSRANPDVMESIVQDTGRPGYISTVLTMYNEGNPGLGATYYERCAQALARGHELYVLTSCQPLSFDFTLTDPYVLLSHAAFDAAGGALVHRTELGGLVSGGSEQIVSFLGSGFVTGLDRGKRDFTSQFDIGLYRAVTSRANLGLTDAFES